MCHGGRDDLEAGPPLAGNGPGYPAIEIAIYPDVIRLAAHNLRTRKPGTLS